MEPKDILRTALQTVVAIIGTGLDPESPTAQAIQAKKLAPIHGVRFRKRKTIHEGSATIEATAPFSRMAPELWLAGINASGRIEVRVGVGANDSTVFDVKVHLPSRSEMTPSEALLFTEYSADVVRLAAKAEMVLHHSFRHYLDVEVFKVRFGKLFAELDKELEEERTQVL